MSPRRPEADSATAPATAPATAGVAPAPSRLAPARDGAASGAAPALSGAATAPSCAVAPGARAMRAVGGAALAKVVVMGSSGLLGIVTSRLIITHFGTAAYGQYGLLTSIPSLLPFADLGIAAVVINAVAAAPDPARDENVRRTLVTAVRALLGSACVIFGVTLVITLLGGWRPLLGRGLLPGGDVGVLVCLTVYAAALPLAVGQRILVGLQRTATQVASQAVVAPFMLVSVATVTALSIPAATYLPVFSYLGNALVSVLCLVAGARLIGPQLRLVVAQVLRPRRVPGVVVRHTAWPMLAQMLVLPFALQTDRVLLSHLAAGPELARFNLASQLFGMPLQTVTTAGVALWPVYARARSSRTIESPARPTLWFLAAGVALGGAMAAVSPWLVGFVARGRFGLDGWVLGGFIAFIAVQAGKYPIGMYMTDPRGLGFQVPFVVLMVPVNLGLSWWLIGLLGAGGTIIASVISVLLCQVLPNALYVRRDLARRRLAAGAGGGGGRRDGTA
jgi:O-antigen/teichoic acid export membrane protein